DVGIDRGGHGPAEQVDAAEAEQHQCKDCDTDDDGEPVFVQSFLRYGLTGRCQCDIRHLMSPALRFAATNHRPAMKSRSGKQAILQNSSLCGDQRTNLLALRTRPMKVAREAAGALTPRRLCGRTGGPFRPREFAMPAPKPPAFETLSLHAGQHPDPST